MGGEGEVRKERKGGSVREERGREREREREREKGGKFI